MPDDVDHDLVLAKAVLDKKESNIIAEAEEDDPWDVSPWDVIVWGIGFIVCLVISVSIGVYLKQRRILRGIAYSKGKYSL